jgi:hypothetical protein
LACTVSKRSGGNAQELPAIAPDKQEIALVHALEVGVTELASRRERFQR